MKRKIGILGGTFDPVHVGHLILAERAYYQFGLEEVLIMPSGNPPHKRNRINRASLEERIEMVRLAILPFLWMMPMRWGILIQERPWRD